MAYGYVYPGYVSLAIVVIFAMVTCCVVGTAAPRSRESAAREVAKSPGRE